MVRCHRDARFSRRLAGGAALRGGYQSGAGGVSAEDRPRSRGLVRRGQAGRSGPPGPEACARRTERFGPDRAELGREQLWRDVESGRLRGRTDRSRSGPGAGTRDFGFASDVPSGRCRRVGADRHPLARRGIDGVRGGDGRRAGGCLSCQRQADGQRRGFRAVFRSGGAAAWWVGDLGRQRLGQPFVGVFRCRSGLRRLWSDSGCAADRPAAGRPFQSCRVDPAGRERHLSAQLRPCRRGPRCSGGWHPVQRRLEPFRDRAIGRPFGAGPGVWRRAGAGGQLYRTARGWAIAAERQRAVAEAGQPAGRQAAGRGQSAGTGPGGEGRRAASPVGPPCEPAAFGDRTRRDRGRQAAH